MKEFGEPNTLTVEALLAADAGEFEASFDNIEDMLAWLNDDADWVPQNPS